MTDQLRIALYVVLGLLAAVALAVFLPAACSEILEAEESGSRHMFLEKCVPHQTVPECLRRWKEMSRR